MTYREKLELYKKGELSKEEAENIKRDLEKQEAIDDYLFGSVEIKTETEINEDKSAPTEDFSNIINKSIRRAFIKAGAVTGAVVMAAVLAVIFILPSVVSLFYYNPNQVIGKTEYGAETKRMDMDISVFSEMFLPLEHRDTVLAESEGYGKYNVVIPQNTSYTGHFTSVSGKLTRGKLTLYDNNVLELPTGNAFYLPDKSHSSGPFGSDARKSFDAIEELNDFETVKAFVSLSKAMTYEEFKKLYSEYSQWVAVYAEDGTGWFLDENIGFATSLTGSVMGWDKEKYPLLSAIPDDGNVDDSEANMTAHFISMINYLTDNSEILDMMDMNANTVSLLAEYKNYIEKNGLQIYGFVFAANKNELRELTKDKNIAYIYTKPVN